MLCTGYFSNDILTPGGTSEVPYVTGILSIHKFESIASRLPNVLKFS